MRPRALVAATCCTAGLMLAGAWHAQTPPAAPPPVHHELDFWLGDWNVTSPDGKPAGRNRIESIANGFGLLENWMGDAAAGGGNGKSLTTYNAAEKQWQQFWVGSGGGVLELSGEFANGQMVLAGSRPTRDGRTLTRRITWTPNADGSVRQLWETSFDGGQTWQTAFDGHYTRKK